MVVLVLQDMEVFSVIVKLAFVKDCFAKPLPVGQAFEPKIHVVIAAVDLAQSRDWHRLWIELDSAYSFSSASSQVYCRFLGILKLVSVDVISAGLYDLCVSYIYREGNHISDKLAS